MLKARDLIGQSDEELEAGYHDTCKEIFALRNELRLSRKLEKPHLLREKKRDKARILTVIRQRKMHAEQEK
jgi:large subunit ribosomal protein L29